MMGPSQMLADFIPGNSFLHRMDIRTRASLFSVNIVMALLFNNPLYSGAVLAWTTGCFIFSGLPRNGVRRMFLMLLPVFIVLFPVTAFSYLPEQFAQPYSRQIIFYLFPHGSTPLTIGGVLLACSFVFRISVMVLSTLLLTYTTPVDEFLRLSQKLRVPYTIAFIITTALRFIPTLENKALMVLNAQRARGAELDAGGAWKRVRAYSSIMIPMIVDSVRMSENLALAMLNRGFGASRRPTVDEESPLRLSDYALLAGSIVFLIISFLLKLEHFGQL
jgi:energy-coupling factor transport system permease protein